LQPPPALGVISARSLVLLTGKISTSPGGLACEARSDGIRAAGTPRVAIDALDGVTIHARGDSGIRAEGNAHVGLGSHKTCRIRADENAIRIHGAARVDLNRCAAVDLGGGIGDDDDDDGFDDDDD
jgi:hypothetical protein